MLLVICNMSVLNAEREVRALNKQDGRAGASANQRGLYMDGESACDSGGSGRREVGEVAVGAADI